MPAIARLLLVLVLSLGAVSPVPSAAAVGSGRSVPSWSWPRPAARVVAPYLQPPHPYGAGHRGIDVDGEGAAVTAPADGVVAFAGRVVDRGVLTIDHGDGWVSSYEPVETELQPGARVGRGEELGVVSAGGHAPTGTLHLGVRLDGEYVNPLLLLGGVPRAVLLPCC
ncbi:murein hydrolase activator EnvC family protein [Microbacterium sp. GXF7504]